MRIKSSRTISHDLFFDIGDETEDGSVFDSVEDEELVVVSYELFVSFSVAEDESVVPDELR